MLTLARSAGCTARGRSRGRDAEVDAGGVSADGKTSTARSMQSPSGLGIFSKPNKEVSLVPFPQSDWHETDHVRDGDGGLAARSADRVQIFRDSRKRTGDGGGEDDLGVAEPGRLWLWIFTRTTTVAPRFHSRHQQSSRECRGTAP